MAVGNDPNAMLVLGQKIQHLLVHENPGAASMLILLFVFSTVPLCTVSGKYFRQGRLHLSKDHRLSKQAVWKPDLKKINRQ